MVMSKILSPSLTGQETSYEEALDWFQFSYMGDNKGEYVAPEKTVIYFSLSVERGPLFSPNLARLRTLYPGAYAWGHTSMEYSLEELKWPHEGI